MILNRAISQAGYEGGSDDKEKCDKEARIIAAEKEVDWDEVKTIFKGLFQFYFGHKIWGYKCMEGSLRK